MNQPDDTRPAPAAAIGDMHILPDTPSSTDAIGSHERIAKALHSLILNTSQGYALALTGTWGSGKSTVIHLLKQILSNPKPPDALLFAFDAWTHEGDSLRRAFVEECIRFIKTCGSLHTDESEYLAALISKFRRKRAISVSHQSPRFHPFAICLAFLGLITPFIWSFHEYLTGWKTDDWRFWPPTVYVSLWALGLLAALTWTAVVAVLRRGKADCTCKYPWQVLRVYAEAPQAVVKDRSIEERDMTSLDFQDEFGQLMRVLSRVSGGKKLVIVIDNLDRVEPEAALALWATMRTFFDPAEREPGSPYYLVVPFDRDAVARMWSHRLQGGGDGGDSAHVHSDYVGVQPQSSPTAAQQLAQEFVGKTFRVTLHVPPVTIIDVRKFLELNARKAQLANEPNELGTLYEVFDQVFSPSFPTPRQIIQFINNCTAMRLANPDSRLEDIAVYVAMSMTGGDVGQRLLALDYAIPREHEDVGSSALRQRLVALHFGVDQERAKHLLFEPPIKKCIEASSPGFPDELLLATGFIEVLERLIGRSSMAWSKGGAHLLFSAIQLVASLEHNSEFAGKLSRAWAHLLSRLSKTEVTLSLSPTDVRAITQLMALRPHDNDAAKGCAMHLRRSLEYAVFKNSEGEAHGATWATETKTFFKQLQADSGEWNRAFRAHFHIPDGVSAQQYIQFAYAAASNDASAVLDFVQPTSKADCSEVVGKLVEDLNVGGDLEHKCKAVYALVNYGSGATWDWTPLVQFSAVKMKEQSGVSESAVEALLEVCWAVYTQHGLEAIQHMRAAVERGSLHQQLDQLRASNKHQGAAKALTLLLLTGTTLDNQNTGRHEAGRKVLDRVAAGEVTVDALLGECAQLLSLARFREWIVPKCCADGLVGAITSRLVARHLLGDPHELWTMHTSPALLSCLPKISGASREAGSVLADILLLRDDLDPTLLAALDVVANEVLFDRALHAFSKGASECSRAVLDALSRSLTGFTQDIWQEVFAHDQDPRGKLAHRLRDVLPDFALGLTAKDALVGLVDTRTKGVGKHAKLIALTHLQLFVKTTVDQIFRDGERSSYLVEEFGELTLDAPKPTVVDPDSLWADVDKLLVRKVPDQIHWFAKYASARKLVLDPDNPTAQAIRDRLFQLQESDGDDVRGAMKQVAQALEVVSTE